MFLVDPQNDTKLKISSPSPQQTSAAFKNPNFKISIIQIGDQQEVHTWIILNSYQLQAQLRYHLAWNRAQVSGTLIHKGAYSIALEFTNKENSSTQACTGVYGPNTRSFKVDFYNELQTIRNSHSLPWVICGDFNTIFSLEDKNKGDSNSRDVFSSQGLLGELSLIDPPLHGNSYTWTNDQFEPILVHL